jgi:sulfur carrier protein ThiS
MPPPESEQETELDSQKLHQLLMQVSQEESARVVEREEAIAKNRERAMRLLAVLEKSQS